MKPIKKSTGGILHCREYPIATSTDIEMGAAVVLTNGAVALAAAGQTTAILGIAAENHGGAADALNPRANGTKVLVYDEPSQIIEQKAIPITATGGTATTIAFSFLGGANDDFNFGKVELLTKVAASTNTDAVGTTYTIADSTYAANVLTLTINAAGGAVTAGDTFLLYPPLGAAIKGLLNATRTEITSGDGSNNVAALPFKCVGHDYDRKTIQVIPTLAVLGNED